MARRSQLIDARDAFAARSAEPVKFPAFAPNMLFLRDLCSGICRTWTARRPLNADYDEIPRSLQSEIEEAIDRNVYSVTSTAVAPATSGISVVFETESHGALLTFSFLVHEKWLSYAENTQKNKA